MIKKTISYVDFNGTQRNDDYYFHLSVPEATRFAARFGEQGWEAGIKKIIDSGDLREVLDLFEDIILTSYGQKSPDGRTFIKNKEMRENFSNSEAYAQLFEELIMSPDAMTQFAKGIGMSTAQQLASKATEPTMRSAT